MTPSATRSATALQDVLPLTSLQEAMIYHSTRPRPAGISDPYLIVARLELAELLGDVDDERLRAAIDTVTARHAALRTSYTRRKTGQPVARVHETVESPWRTEQIADTGDVDRIIDDARAVGIDLTSPPPLRWVRITGAGVSSLVLIVHHVALDGWSIHRVLAEIVAAYAGSTLAEPVPLSGYLRYLGDRHADPGTAIDAWVASLDGVDEPTRIAPDIIDPAPVTSPVAALAPVTSPVAALAPVTSPVAALAPVTRTHHRLSEADSTTLRQIAREAGVTLNTLMQLAWAQVLAEHTDRDDVVFGTVVSGRDPHHPGVDEIVGMLVNTIPVRVRLDPTRTVAQTLAQLQREALGLAAHHHTALADIGTAVGIGELFDSLVVFESFPRGAVRPLIEDENTYPATLLVEDDPSIGILFENRGADASLLTEFLAHLDALVAHGDTPIGRIPRVRAATLTPARTPAEYRSVSTRLSSAAAVDPAAIAVACGGESITYGDLDTRARRLATVLRGRGIGADSVVAVLLPRSVDAVVVLAAVIHCGAAYLPLDLTHPTERLRFMLDDAAPDLIVDEDALAELLADADSAAGAPVEPSVPHPDSLAYLIYTSGSTGVPKAVSGTARALDNRIAWAAQEWRAPSVLAKSSFAFIDGTTELLGALAAGARIVLADDTTAGDAAALAALAADTDLRQVTAVPSLAAAMLDAAELQGDPTARERWIVSGEPLPPPTARALTATGAALINSYGSSEVAGDVAFGEITAGEDVHVGHQVPGAGLHILDRLLRPVADGMAGELYVSGVQLARGYRGQAAQTAARFIAHPHSAGARMYRTGDRARRGPDGRVELLGRSDSQVKIRGHRVELGEVEAAVLALPGVDEAVVTATTDPSGDTRLNAYLLASLTADGPAPVTADDYITALRELLPRHMIPTTWTLLPAIPRTPGGKVDRRALPEPSAPTRGGRVAATDTERLVVATVADVLGLDDPPPADADFVELGGNSLSATRVLTRLRVATGVALGVADIFDHPTLDALAARLDADLDAPARTGDTAATADTVPDEPTPVAQRPDPMPLSPAQRRLLFQSTIDDSAYTIPFAVRLRPQDGSAIDVNRLAASLNAIIERHEVLRTRIVDGAAVIDPAASLSIDEHRCAPAELDDTMAELIARPFDLSAEVPVRADLFRIAGDDGALLLITVHHIAADEWSAGRFFGELADGYNGTPVTPPTIQYADHTLWQLARLGDPERDGTLAHRQLRYWQQTLADAPAELSLPYDRPRGTDRDHRGAQVDAIIDAQTLAHMRSRGSATTASSFMLVHTAVALALSASGAGTDVVVGSPIANRGAAAADDLIGMFVNTIALRTDLSGNPTLGEVLDRVRRTDLDAYAHADLPFDSLVGALAPDRSLARHPVFQTMVQYRDPIVAPTFTGLDAVPVLPRSTTSKFDLTVEFVELPDAAGIDVRVEYATELFDESTVSALTGRILRALDALLTQPTTRVAELVLDGGDDEITTHAAEFEHPAQPSLIHVLASTVGTHPDRVAVTTTDVSLTYAELDARSTALARRLIADGVRPGDLVALLMPRSADLVVAVLGVLRAGAAYVPVDPHYPAERIALIIDDAAPAVTVDPDYVAAATEPHAADAQHPALPTVGPDHPAYVIFTSGSTGRPKGVGVTHGNVTALLAATADRFTVGPDDVWTLFHSYAFDFSVWELWGPLSTGGRLVVPDHDTVRSPADVAALIAANGITVLNQTPTAFFALDAADADVAESVTGGPLDSLRYIIFGGEALDLPRLVGFADRHPDVALVNMYGITETTVHASHLELAREHLDDAVGSDVGALLPGFDGLLLDDYLRPVPTGATGELYLRGPQVASGYLGRPGLTATRFVAVPAQSHAGAVMYRTGDLFRRTAGDALLYAGRADTQVKIRGFRIELGEIRAALAEFDRVRDVAVITRPGPSGDRILAYVVVDTQPSAVSSDILDPDALRTALADRLPEHMIPAAITVIDAIPVTVNGKTDAAALPEPDLATASGRAPRGFVEEVLAEIVAETLGLPDTATIGADDDFFALGGDSISSTTLVNRARRRGLQFSPRDVFTHRTVEALAAVVETTDSPTTAAAGSESTGSQTIPLLPVMHRLRELGGRIDRFNQSLVVDLPVGITTDEVIAALQLVLDTHLALRTSLTVIADTVWTLTAAPAGVVRAADLTISAPLDAHGTAAETISVESDRAAARLAPRDGRMVAAVHLTAADPRDAGRLILVIHHLAVDGVSRRIILDDLAAAHAALREGHTPDAVSHSTPLATHAAAVGARANAPEVLGEAEHWVGVLAAGGELLPGTPARGGLVGDLRRHRVDLTTAASEALLTEVPAALGVGVTALFLGALRTAAGRTLSTGDLVVDTERHGRATDEAGLDSELSHTVGWFTTIAPLRLPPADDLRAAILDADRRWEETPGAGAGFGMLRYLNPQLSAALATLPRPSVLLNYLGRFSVGGGVPWQPAVESEALTTDPDPDLGCAYPVEIDVVCRDTADGPVLTATFAFLPAEIADDQVAALADAWRTGLDELAAQYISSFDDTKGAP